MEKREIEMRLRKSTPGTYVYEEESEGKPPLLKTQYIQRWVLGSRPPQKIKITLEFEPVPAEQKAPA
jgi:hypothetical protein